MNLDAIAAQRIVALRVVRGIGQSTEMSRVARVIEDHVLVELAKAVVHRQPNIVRALASAATSASTSERVL